MDGGLTLSVAAVPDRICDLRFAICELLMEGYGGVIGYQS